MYWIFFYCTSTALNELHAMTQTRTECLDIVFTVGRGWKVCDPLFQVQLPWRHGSFSQQKRISFEPTSTYLLKDLKPFTTYTFQLAARSKHGVGAYTNEISAETPQTRRSSSISKSWLDSFPGSWPGKVKYSIFKCTHFFPTRYRDLNLVLPVPDLFGLKTCKAYKPSYKSEDVFENGTLFHNYNK